MSPSKSTQESHSSKLFIPGNDEYLHLDIPCNATDVYQSTFSNNIICSLLLFADIFPNMIAMSYPSNKEECDKRPGRNKIEEGKQYLE